MEDATAQTESQQAPAQNEGIARYLFIIGFGVFVTTIAQVKAIGLLPLQMHLIRDMKLSATDVSMFFLIGTFAWYIKPLFGLVADSMPLFGSPRRTWLILSSMLAAACWMGMGAFENRYKALLGACVLVNVAMVMASTVIGGLLVVEGQKHGATGRFSSLRLLTQNLTFVFVGPVSGYLAARAFHLTAWLGAALMVMLAAAVALMLPEQKVDTRNTAVWYDAWVQMKEIYHSRTMWAAAGLLFLVMVSPGFNTPLLIYSTKQLHFNEQFIGNLQFWSALPGLVAAAAYALVCKRISLKPLLFWGIALNAAFTLLYLWYNGPTAAILINMVTGFVGTLALIPVMDLATRATPSGSGSFGYALMMSVYNIAIQLSDIAGSYLFDHRGLTFKSLVWVNAGTTAMVLIFIPLLPKILMSRRDGEPGG
ncbi:MAG TPA: MFS transporter [Armatimonadota bacterium]